MNGRHVTSLQEVKIACTCGQVRKRYFYMQKKEEKNISTIIDTKEDTVVA